jgi:cytochrome c peroxidase
VKDGDQLGLTCAACHTTQIQFNGKAYLIDGGPTMADAVRFQRDLVSALNETERDAAKFGRFASAVLGSTATEQQRNILKAKLSKVVEFREAYNHRNLPDEHGTAFGPARIDAFGAILNEVGATFAQRSSNFVAANAPVSYPFLWDTPQHEVVQWNGSAENSRILALEPVVGTADIGALSRNVGEVLGVFGVVDTKSTGSLLEFHGYQSSANKPNLIAIENLLRKLWSPKLPPEISATDSANATKGRSLFTQFCASCHADIKRDDPNRTVKKQIDFVGTDQTMARNVATRTASSGVFQGRLASLRGARLLGVTERSTDLLVHLVERIIVRPDANDSVVEAITTMSERGFSAQYTIHAQVGIGKQKLQGAFPLIELQGSKVRSLRSTGAIQLVDEKNRVFLQDRSNPQNPGRFTSTAADSIGIKKTDATVHTESAGTDTIVTFIQPAAIEFGYKARPLNGIWATAPYLHNGSVPNLDELLKPAMSRMKTFHVGSREFDPVHLGFKDDGPFLFDTSLPGNSNAGHEYSGPLTDDERMQLIEYLKSL